MNPFGGFGGAGGGFGGAGVGGGGAGGAGAGAGAGTGGTTLKNVHEIDSLLTFDELYEVLAGDNPTPSKIGPGWNNLNIVYILQYHTNQESWVESLWFRCTVGIVGVLFVVYIVVLLYAVYVCGAKRLGTKIAPTKEPAVKRDGKVRISEVSPGPPDYMEHAWRAGDLPPPPPPPAPPPIYDKTSMFPPLPAIHTPPPPSGYIPEPVFYEPVHSTRNGSPSEIVVKPADYVKGNGSLLGTDIDPNTGRMNEYYRVVKQN